MKLPIFDSDNWREIFATLSRNKTRTFLTAFGIFWGTAMLGLLWGGADGLQGMLMRNFNGFATNMGATFGGRTTKSYRGFNKGTTWNLNSTDVALIRHYATDIDLSSTMLQLNGTFKYGTKSKSGMVQGVESDFFSIQVPLLVSGRLINASDCDKHLKVAVIGSNVADELFGGKSPLGAYIEISGIYFKVIGVARQKSDASIGGRLDDGVIVPGPTMQTAYNIGNNIGVFLYTAREGKTPSDIQPVIKAAVRKNHPIDPTDEDAFWFMDISEQFKMVENLFLGVKILALFVGFGTLLAGVIGVGNIMWIIVKERTQEIGIRRAIGAKPVDIIIQILSESMALTSIAGIGGICFAALVLAAVDKLTFDPVLGSAHFQLDFSSAVIILVLFLVLGTAAGIIPSVKAMRIKPIEAINDK